MDWDSGAGQAAGRAPMVTATAQEEWRSSGVGCGVEKNTEMRANFGAKRWRVTLGKLWLCFFGEYAREKN